MPKSEEIADMGPKRVAQSRKSLEIHGETGPSLAVKLYTFYGVKSIISRFYGYPQAKRITGNRAKNTGNSGNSGKHGNTGNSGNYGEYGKIRLNYGKNG